MTEDDTKSYQGDSVVWDNGKPTTLAQLGYDPAKGWCIGRRVA